MPTIVDKFTSTGAKFWNHPEALEGLRNGKPRPVVSHIMPTDTCQHSCAFCSVVTRDGNSLSLQQIKEYLDQLVPLGLKATIISGGGNPILYPQFNEMISLIHGYGLKIGLITNGMPLAMDRSGRVVWKNVSYETTRKLTWVRVSMSGLDHEEQCVYVPQFDRSCTTLGFSYVYHDIYTVPEDPHHGKVSTQHDLIQLGVPAQRVVYGKDRLEWLAEEISKLVIAEDPQYVRLLPNCLEPDLIQSRCDVLQLLATAIDPSRVFVQYKPPAAPQACYLGYLHPVLNTDGYVYPCDSCVLNKAAGHRFAEPWRMCRWDEIAKIYTSPVRSLVEPTKLCPMCVFTNSNELLKKVYDGLPLQAPDNTVEHPDFI